MARNYLDECPFGFMCDVCREEKLLYFRSEVLTDPQYEADEQIEADY